MNGRMQWQKSRGVRSAKLFGTGEQRYQRTFGDTMHARVPRQQQEAMIASGALNKMTSLGMPKVIDPPKF